MATPDEVLAPIPQLRVGDKLTQPDSHDYCYVVGIEQGTWIRTLWFRLDPEGHEIPTPGQVVHNRHGAQGYHIHDLFRYGSPMVVAGHDPKYNSDRMKEIFRTGGDGYVYAQGVRND